MKISIISVLFASLAVFAVVGAAPFTASDILPWNWPIFQHGNGNGTSAIPGAGTASLKEILQEGQATGVSQSPNATANLSTLNSNSSTVPPTNSSFLSEPKKFLEELIPQLKSKRDLIYEYDGYN